MSELQGPQPGEFLLYETEDGRTRVECWFAEDIMWLSQAMMAELFQASPKGTLQQYAGRLHREHACKTDVRTSTSWRPAIRSCQRVARGRIKRMDWSIGYRR